MKQVILTAPKQFEVREVAAPKANDNQALLRVKAVGICGSDIHAYHGEHPFMPAPVVMGHEGAGEVIEVGKNVKNVAVGDRVVFRPQKICGECIFCKSGRYNICKELKVLGCQDVGASSDYYAVDADLLYKLPAGLDYPEGTVIEPLSVGVHAVKRGLPDGVNGQKVLVIGAGTIGNMVAQAAKGLGAGKIIITDLSERKLEIAKACGLSNVVNVGKENLEEVVLREFGPDGADVIYECTSSEAALRPLLQFARKGSRIVIVGVYGKEILVNLGNVQDREYELIGTLMYLHEDYVDAIRLVEEGKVNLSAVITDKYPLEQTADAYAYIDANRDNVQKVILTVGE